MEILGQDPAPATKNMWYENKYRVTMVVRDFVLFTLLWLLYLLLVLVRIWQKWQSSWAINMEEPQK